MALSVPVMVSLVPATISIATERKGRQKEDICRCLTVSALSQAKVE